MKKTLLISLALGAVAAASLYAIVKLHEDSEIDRELEKLREVVYRACRR